MSSDIQELVDPLKRLHERLRDRVVAACEEAADQPGREPLAQVHREGAEDTIYAIDRLVEGELLAGMEELAEESGPLVLIAEGLPDGSVVLPPGASPQESRWRLIVDPIDGSRGLMHQKRSAWILTGAAPDRGPATTLADLEIAVQTEIPLVKQHLSDAVWARKGGGVRGERYNRLNGERTPLQLAPSAASSPRHGFATVVRFFPGARELLGAIDDELFEAALGSPFDGRASCFEDQYISSGGQLYELMAGRDRLVIDVRPMALRKLSAGRYGEPCAHPYDLCTELAAREAGVVVTAVDGEQLRAPLDVRTPVNWVAFANTGLAMAIQPLLQEALRKRGLFEPQAQQ